MFESVNPKLPLSETLPALSMVPVAIHWVGVRSSLCVRVIWHPIWETTPAKVPWSEAPGPWHFELTRQLPVKFGQAGGTPPSSPKRLVVEPPDPPLEFGALGSNPWVDEQLAKLESTSPESRTYNVAARVARLRSTRGSFAIMGCIIPLLPCELSRMTM